MWAFFFRFRMVPNQSAVGRTIWRQATKHQNLDFVSPVVKSGYITYFSPNVGTGRRASWSCPIYCRPKPLKNQSRWKGVMTTVHAEHVHQLPRSEGAIQGQTAPRGTRASRNTLVCPMVESVHSPPLILLIAHPSVSIFLHICPMCTLMWQT